jgi:hypothetical protein
VNASVNSRSSRRTTALHPLVAFCNDRLVLAGALGRRPGDRIPSGGERGLVRLDGAFLPGNAIMENVDVIGEARAAPVDGDPARDITVGASLGARCRNTSDWNLLIGTAKRFDALREPPPVHAAACAKPG